MNKGLFAELKRRHVYRVAVAYAVVGWMLIEVSATIVPALHLSDSLTTVVVVLVALGFPVALILAWAFEMTPEGVRRTEPVDSPQARAPEQHRHVGRKLDFIIIGVLVLTVAVLGWRLWSSHYTSQTAVPSTSQASTAAPAKTSKPQVGATEPAAPSTTAIPPKSIAVLPFENLSTDKANGYFADGMQDLILTKLADIGELKVISRTSTAKYASHPDDLKTIAQQLGVANILEGSVQKAGNSVLINVQLINARTDAHIWAQAYTRTLDNVFGVEGEVAGKIADALKAKLSPAETKRLATALSDDPTANDLYLRAQYFVNAANGSSKYISYLKQAIAFYRQAVAKVPDFALARARLSYAESWLAFNGGGGEDVKQLDTDARMQAQKAMSLAPNLAESHLAIGYCDYYGKGDYDAALKAFGDGLELRPNDADVYSARGFVLRRQGKFDAAIDALKRAQVLDPRSAVPAWNLGETYMSTGRYLEAEQVLRHAMALDPANDSARIDYTVSIGSRTGDLNRMLTVLQGNSATLKEWRAFLLLATGNSRAALALAKSIPDTPDNFDPGSKDMFLGNIYRLSGDAAQARKHYAKALPLLREQLPKLGNHLRTVAGQWDAIAQAELGLGKPEAGIAAIKASLAAGEKSGDRFNEPLVLRQAADRYAQAGRADQAVSLLSRLLTTPGGGYFYAPVWLWLDPNWNPIRKSPEFQALLKEYAKYRPQRGEVASAK